jgi:hypothetical protein
VETLTGLSNNVAFSVSCDPEHNRESSERFSSEILMSEIKSPRTRRIDRFTGLRIPMGDHAVAGGHRSPWDFATTQPNDLMEIALTKASEGLYVPYVPERDSAAKCTGSL